MVLIITNNGDLSSSHLIKWLIHSKIQFLRINDEDKSSFSIKHFNIENKLDFIFEFKNKEYKLSQFNSIFFRRGNLLNQYEISEYSKDYFKEVNKYVSKKIVNINTFFHTILLKKHNTGGYLKSNLNKLVVLNEALQVGFKIPKSIITTYSKQIKKFKKEHDKIITKPIFEAFSYFWKNKRGNFSILKNYTSRVLENDLKNLPNEIFPSLFQKEMNHYGLKVHRFGLVT